LWELVSGQNAAVAVVLPDAQGNPTSHIVIGSLWPHLTGAEGGPYLVHEAMHAALGKKDPDLWNLAQSNGAVPRAGRTDEQNFTRWLQAGCPDERKK
jgi:hypothetical protein